MKTLILALSFIFISFLPASVKAGEINSAKTAAEVVEDFHDEAEGMVNEFVSPVTLERMNGLKDKAIKEIEGINLSQRPGVARYNNLKDAVTGYMDAVLAILEGATGADSDEVRSTARRLKASKTEGLSRIDAVHKQEVLKGTEGPPVPSIDRPREDKDGAADIWYR